MTARIEWLNSNVQPLTRRCLELSHILIYKNLAIAQIARQLRTQYVESMCRPKYYTVTLKCRLNVA